MGFFICSDLKVYFASARFLPTIQLNFHLTSHLLKSSNLAG